MKSASQFALTVLVGAALVGAGLCMRALGIPVSAALWLVIGGVAVLGFASYRLSHARMHGLDPHGTMPHDASNRARIRYFWFVSVGLVLASVLVIPLLPYAIEDYTPQLLYWVIPAQIVAVGLFLLYLRRRLFSSRLERNGKGAAP